MSTVAPSRVRRSTPTSKIQTGVGDGLVSETDPLDQLPKGSVSQTKLRRASIMAQLSQQTLEELRGIISEEYGKNLTVDEVARLANDLVGYFDLLAKIQHRQSGVELNK